MKTQADKDLELAIDSFYCDFLNFYKIICDTSKLLQRNATIENIIPLFQIYIINKNLKDIDGTLNYIGRELEQIRFLDELQE